MTANPKATVGVWPAEDCMYCFVVCENRGPAGTRNNNPAVGWGVAYHGQTIHQATSLREAKRWAEERFAIKGWNRVGRAPYHHTAAVPE
jgi:hypothetical protein